MTFGWGAEKANVVSCVALQFALCHDHRSSVGHVAIPDSFQQKLEHSQGHKEHWKRSTSYQTCEARHPLPEEYK